MHWFTPRAAVIFALSVGYFEEEQLAGRGFEIRGDARSSSRLWDLALFRVRALALEPPEFGNIIHGELPLQHILAFAPCKSTTARA
eukprot:3054592-Pyramimonas_sp.AAC.1